MPDIFTKVDYKKIAARLLGEWDGFGLPKADLSKLELKIMPFRKIGLHSLLTFMVFCEGKPLLVMKFPRYLEGRLAFSGLRNEAAMLEKIKIPELFKLLEIDGAPVLLMRAYEGKMLHHFLDAGEDLEKLAGFLRHGVNLLIELSRKTKEQLIKIDEDFIERHLLVPAREALEYFPDQIAPLQEYLNTFLSNNQSAIGLEVPLLLTHHEFNPWNILVDPEGKLILLDWEDAENSGLPFLDLYNFFTVAFRIMYYGETSETQSRSPEQKQARKELLLREFRAAAQKYCQALGCSEKLLDIFYLAFALKQTTFFLNEKRHDINYASSWLALLAGAPLENCFIDHVVKEGQ
ncbi:MAG: phosphotransferase [Candidatus Margulisiibacteriota bacterium]